MPEPALELSPSRWWSGKAFFAVLVWGASFVATRMALEVFHANALAAARFAISAVTLTVLARATGVPLVPAGGRGVCVILGVISAGHLLIQAYGLERTSAVRTGWIIGFIPVTIAIGARIFLRQRLAPLAWGGVAVATCGIGVMMSQEVRQFAHARAGDMLQLVSCLTWTAYTLIGAKPVRRHGSLTITTSVMWVSAIAILPVALLGGPLLRVESSWTAQSAWTAVGAVLFLGVFCSGLAYHFWYTTLNELGAARTGAYLYLEPFVTLAVARLTLREPVGIKTVIGGCLILVGVYAISRGGRRAATE